MSQDTIINDQYVIFQVGKCGEDAASVTAFEKTYYGKQLVRVFLGPGVKHGKRLSEQSHYYLNNLYVHQYSFDDSLQQWTVTLRGSVPQNTDNPNKCICCILM